MIQSIFKNHFVCFIIGVLFLLASLLILQLGITPQRQYQAKEPPYVGDNKMVYVGEMYFQQASPELPRNTLRFAKGDVVKFYNEGSVPHTVTIEEFGFDKIINPGESTIFTANKTAENITVLCRFHPGHRARLTVIDETESRPR